MAVIKNGWIPFTNTGGMTTWWLFKDYDVVARMRVVKERSFNETLEWKAIWKPLMLGQYG